MIELRSVLQDDFSTKLQYRVLFESHLTASGDIVLRPAKPEFLTWVDVPVISQESLANKTGHKKYDPALVIRVVLSEGCKDILGLPTETWGQIAYRALALTQIEVGSTDWELTTNYGGMLSFSQKIKDTPTNLGLDWSFLQVYLNPRAGIAG